MSKITANREIIKILMLSPYYLEFNLSERSALFKYLGKIMQRLSPNQTGSGESGSGFIRAVHRAEGNIDCNATEGNETCGEGRCLWCEGSPEKKMVHLSETVDLIIRRLRNCVAVLSLIIENAAKDPKDERFLTYSFEALSDQVKKIDEVIQICSHMLGDGKITSPDERLCP